MAISGPSRDPNPKIQCRACIQGPWSFLHILTNCIHPTTHKLKRKLTKAKTVMTSREIVIKVTCSKPLFRVCFLWGDSFCSDIYSLKLFETLFPIFFEEVSAFLWLWFWPKQTVPNRLNLLMSKKIAMKLFKVIRTPSDMRSVQDGISPIKIPYRPKDTETKIHGLTLLMRKPDTIDAAIPPNLKEIKHQ